MTVFGLPIHPLIVHATVVIVPTAALAVLLATLWPRFRRWASWGPFAAAAAALVLVPLSTSSGESLEHSMPHSVLIEKHAHLADGLLPWSIVLLVGAIGVFWIHWSTEHPNVRSLPRWFAIVAMVVAVVAAAGSLVEVVLIGHSGAAAAWSGVR